jgi:peptide chain release factor 2
VSELESKTADPNFWNDRENAEEVLSELNRLKKRIEPWKEIRREVEEADQLYQLAVEEDDDGTLAEVEELLEALERKHGSLRLSELLSDKYDSGDAFLTIHSGAGGTEACDWVQMLLRMYTRWVETRGYRMEILDMLEAEGGIKSVTAQIQGDSVYGYLKGETGIHRLVRISPFDSNKRRHTSFASVYVSPVIEEDIEVEIRPDDIRVDTYRAQGAGGQHVNKTDSAVRITHLETGMVVQCQNERSQHKNKAMAMKVLKSRLYEHYQEIADEEQAKHAQEKKDISWGNQIRSYVFHPYNMVKDHRTDAETGNVQAVMDGDIDRFIEAYLKWNWAQSN